MSELLLMTRTMVSAQGRRNLCSDIHIHTYMHTYKGQSKSFCTVIISFVSFKQLNRNLIYSLINLINQYSPAKKKKQLNLDTFTVTISLCFFPRATMCLNAVHSDSRSLLPHVYCEKINKKLNIIILNTTFTIFSSINIMTIIWY